MEAKIPEGRGRRRGTAGFTLIELIVVCLIIGILAAFAVPAYLKSVETSKADDAVALVNMIATTNKMFALDHGNIYTTGSLTTSGSGCNPGDTCPTAGPYGACALVACKYLAAQDWDSKAYSATAGDGAGNGCAAGVVACVSRRTSGTNSAAYAPYTGWGYTMGLNGVITSVGGAPTPVQ